MSVSIYEASVPVFAKSLTNVAAWLEKALAEGGAEGVLMQACLAPESRARHAALLSADTVRLRQRQGCCG
jgi:hypothetical protein